MELQHALQYSRPTSDQLELRVNVDVRGGRRGRTVQVYKIWLVRCVNLPTPHVELKAALSDASP